MANDPRYQVTREVNVRVPMRDAVVLRADVYRPNTDEPLPVLVRRTPYGKDAGADDPNNSAYYFAERGYVVVYQDCRGRFNSEGEYYALVNEAQDGYDTVEWAARQPWSNGKVGTFGQSYPAAVQYLMAPTAPPHLRATAPISASCDFHQSWVYHTGGPMIWGWIVSYTIDKGLNTLQRIGREDLLLQMDNYEIERGKPLRDEWFRHLPLKEWGKRLKEAAPYFADYLSHPDDGEYWWRINTARQLDRVRVPQYHISGWYDIFLEGPLAHYVGLRKQGATPEAREGQRLLIGPWAHLYPFVVPTSRGTGDIDFGPEAAIELHPRLLHWFDHWLKGKQTPLLEEPPILLFVMGRNQWRYENEWPLARTRYTPYYLHSDGGANSLHGDGSLSPLPPEEESTDSYVYDPRNPVPTRGGNHLRIPFGVFDQQETEERPDVLVYTTPALEEELEVTGPLAVTLYAASTAPDTDFTAKLVDVRPDGYCQNIQDGVIRARYRDSATHPTPIRPGEVYRYTIDLWATSHVFLRGHKVRLEVSSSNFPRFDRNPNTGAPFGDDERLETARQAILHDRDHPSHILLPVIPRG